MTVTKGEAEKYNCDRIQRNKHVRLCGWTLLKKIAAVSLIIIVPFSVPLKTLGAYVSGTEFLKFAYSMNHYLKKKKIVVLWCTKTHMLTFIKKDHIENPL